MKKRIVITGIGVIAPNGIGKAAFWEAIREGRSGIRNIGLFEPDQLNIRMAGECSDFEAEKFLGSKGLRNLDRSTKLLCSAVKLALEDASFVVTENNANDIGVVTATTLSVTGDLAKFTREVVQDGPQSVNPALFPPTTMNFPSSQVSLWHKIKGFNTTISTGYTAGLDAIKYAFDMIESGRAKVALAAGVESLTLSALIGFHQIGFLAGLKGQEILCPFDKRHNGIILGEGAAVLVLEEESHALSRNAFVHAEVLSVANTFDAFRPVKYDPEAAGLKLSMRKALQKVRISEDSIDYIASAANAVPQQDTLETKAIKEVFSVYAKAIPVSAIKSMIGETVSVSGCFQAAAAVGSIKEKFIPPTINFEEPASGCDLDYVPNQARVQRIKNVMINNFGPGGNNTSAIIAQY